MPPGDYATVPVLVLLLSFAPLALCAAVYFGINTGCSSGSRHGHGDVPYAVTPHHMVEQMMELGNVGVGSRVVDCGCGDGRMLVAASRRGASADGYELAWYPLLLARLNALLHGRGRVRVHRKDFFDADLSSATHVVLNSYCTKHHGP